MVLVSKAAPLEMFLLLAPPALFDASLPGAQTLPSAVLPTTPLNANAEKLSMVDSWYLSHLMFFES